MRNQHRLVPAMASHSTTESVTLGSQNSKAPTTASACDELIADSVSNICSFINVKVHDGDSDDSDESGDGDKDNATTVQSHKRRKICNYASDPSSVDRLVPITELRRKIVISSLPQSQQQTTEVHKKRGKRKAHSPYTNLGHFAQLEQRSATCGNKKLLLSLGEYGMCIQRRHKQHSIAILCMTDLEKECVKIIDAAGRRRGLGGQRAPLPRPVAPPPAATAADKASPPVAAAPVAAEDHPVVASNNRPTVIELVDLAYRLSSSATESSDPVAAQWSRHFDSDAALQNMMDSCCANVSGGENADRACVEKLVQSKLFSGFVMPLYRQALTLFRARQTRIDSSAQEVDTFAAAERAAAELVDSEVGK